MRNSTSLAWLVGFEGTPNEIHYELTSPKTVIGRGADCDLQLEDQLISRRHAVLHLGDETVEIEDLGSSNGTLLNGKQISRSPVKNGDRIEIGNTILQLRMEADPDATIIKPKEPQETIIAIRQTVPHEIGAVECPECGISNPQGGSVCYSCGSILPQLPEEFQKTLEIFDLQRRSYQAGKISQEKYHKALARLMVQDQNGTFWMPGVDSGEWHWHDGENWLLGDPPLIIPGEEEEPALEVADTSDQEMVQETAPKGSPRRRWGVIALWVFSALVVLVLGVYAGYEIVHFTRERPSVYSDPPGYIENDPTEHDISEDSGDAVLPGADPSTTSEEISIRPYDPISDVSLSNLTAQAVWLKGQSTDMYALFEGTFEGGSSAVLSIGWCAIDQATMEGNMVSIHMDAALDGIMVPEEAWTVEDSQEEGMFCRIFRAVAENISPGAHQYLTSSSYDVPINDGWDTYPPGTYIEEFNISIPGSEQSGQGSYTYADDFQNDRGHWGDLDQEEVKIWIDGGDLHIMVNQAGISGISHFEDREFSDFILATTAHSLGDHSGMYGVVFRYQDDQNYYSFQVTELGLYRVVIKVQGETTELVPWTESALIHGQVGANELEVSMQGDHILASINGQGVADLRDPTFIEGNLSLIAGSQVSMEKYHAVFLQVSIEAPE
jgi:hypothetical protein